MQRFLTNGAVSGALMIDAGGEGSVIFIGNLFFLKAQGGARLRNVLGKITACH
jgi:hypothetical protein